MFGKRRICNTARNTTKRQRLSATQTPVSEKQAHTAQMLETAAEATSSTDRSSNILQTKAVVNGPSVENAEVEAGSGSLEESWVDAYELFNMLQGADIFQDPVFYLKLYLRSHILSSKFDKVTCIKDTDVWKNAFYEALKGNPIKLKNQEESEWVCNRRRELALKAAENQFFKYRPLTLASDSASDSVKALRDEWLNNVDKNTLSNIKNSILGLPDTIQNFKNILSHQNNLKLIRYMVAEFVCTILLCARDVDLTSAGNWQLKIWKKTLNHDICLYHLTNSQDQMEPERVINSGVLNADMSYCLTNQSLALSRNYTTFATIHDDFKILKRSLSRLAAAAYLRCVFKMSDGTYQQDSIDMISNYAYMRCQYHFNPTDILPYTKSDRSGTETETEAQWLARVTVIKPKFKS